MDTKYKDVTLDDYSVRRYEDSRDSFLSFADMICKSIKEYLERIFKGKHSGKTFEFDFPVSVIRYDRIRMVKEARKKKYILETEDSKHTAILDTSDLEMMFEILIQLQSELDTDDYYEDDYSDEASSLWQDFRDLMQPFFAQMNSHHTGLDYVFDSPITTDGVEYTHLYLVENDDAGLFGYDDYYISSSDGEHIELLEYANPYLFIKVADKLIAESRKTSLK